MVRSGAQWKPNADAKAAIMTGVERGVGLAAEHVLAESRKIVPHETGVLERSGRASSEQGRAVVRGAVSYDTPYQRSQAA